MSNAISKSKISRCKKEEYSLDLSLSERFRCINISQKRELHIKFDSLSEFEQKQFIKDMKVEYSLIVFDYFSSKDNIENKIKCFAKKVFNVNLPMNKIVEIHVDLIDTLEHQLMLEGLHTDYMSDFRLTLIDVIAHLGELYRNAMYQKV